MLLRTRIIVFVLLVVSTVAGLVFAVGSLRERNLEGSIADLKLEQLEQAWGYAVSDVTGDLARRILAMSQSRQGLAEAVQRGEWQELAGMLGSVSDQLGFLRMEVFGSGGQLIWSSEEGSDEPPLVAGNRLTASVREDIMIAGPRALGVSGIGVVAAVPVQTSGSQRTLGWVAAAVPLHEVLLRLEHISGTRVFVQDVDGQHIFGSADHPFPWAGQLMPAKRRGLEVLQVQEQHKEFAFLPVADLMGGPLATLIRVRDVTASVDEIKLWDRALLASVLTVLVGALLMLYLFLRRHFEVLDDAVSALQDLTGGRVGTYVELPQGANEIGRIAVAVEAFGHALGEVGRIDAQRERRQRRQQRFIRRQMEELASTLEDDARYEVLEELRKMEAMAEDPDSPQSRATSDELGLIALGFSRLATKVSVQQVQLTQLVKDLREALEDKRKLISLQQELQIAASMQLSILPNSFPELPMLDMVASMHPAKEVGGDFYDFFEVRDRVLGVVIADVSGKGIPAAFFMLISRTMLRTVAMSSDGPAQTLARLNNLLAAENEQMMFVTIFYAEIDLDTGQVRYCNGGHNPPCLAHGDGRVEFVPGTSSIALATFPDLPYQERSLQMAAGDTLVMFTDGVTEAFAADGSMYGEDRLRQALAQGGAAGSSAVALERVMADLEAFTLGAQQSDDITAIVVHWKL